MKKNKSKRIHVVINPAAGQAEPILSMINATFNKYEIDWEVSITKKYGDAIEFAKKAVKDGFDIVAGYGGDGTQHEIANGIIGSDVIMGVLPGGTGNGYANGLGIPRDTQKALEILASSEKTTKVDVVNLGDKYMITRMYIGIEPEEQTSRDSKDKYGMFAYGIDALNRLKNVNEYDYKITIDGDEHKLKGVKCYIVNSGSTGAKISIGDFDMTDGLLDVFMLNKDFKSLVAATERLVKLDTKASKYYYKQGKEIKIETSESQPVWVDGEFYGRTPIDVKIMHEALEIVTP